MNISLLLPTRKRPDNIKRLWQSVLDTADHPDQIELVLAVDDDDDSYDDLGIGLIQKYPRMVLSQYWNECYKRATADILMHCGDDIAFQTKGWDTIVLDKFKEFPDNIVFVYGDDGYWGQSFGTHGFIHRDWAEAVGYFVPPYFSSDYNDTWLNDVAKKIERWHYVDIFTEHFHPAHGKAEWDETHNDRLERHKRDNVDELYQQKETEREGDAAKLKEVIRERSRSQQI